MLLARHERATGAVRLLLQHPLEELELLELLELLEMTKKRLQGCRSYHRICFEGGPCWQRQFQESGLLRTRRTSVALGRGLSNQTIPVAILWDRCP